MDGNIMIVRTLISILNCYYISGQNRTRLTSGLFSIALVDTKKLKPDIAHNVEQRIPTPSATRQTESTTQDETNTPRVSHRKNVDVHAVALVLLGLEDLGSHVSRSSTPAEPPPPKDTCTKSMRTNRDLGCNERRRTRSSYAAVLLPSMHV